MQIGKYHPFLTLCGVSLKRGGVVEGLLFVCDLYSLKFLQPIWHMVLCMFCLRELFPFRTVQLICCFFSALGIMMCIFLGLVP